MNDSIGVARAAVTGVLSGLAISVLAAHAGCASTTANASADDGGSEHGTMSGKTAASDAELCEHRVPGDVCTRCHPELAADFKASGDWCPEHDRPESQCYLCHPDLSFEPMPALKPGADWAVVTTGGKDVPRLEDHLARGKVTIVDFYADWCMPCRKVDRHVIALVNARSDVAVRKLDMSSWDTPLSKRYLANVKELPYLMVFGKDGQRVATITGLDLEGLDAAIAKAAAGEGAP